MAMVQIYLGRLIGDFMRAYPKVRVELEATDRVVNLIDERVDVALRALNAGLADPGLVARRIASGRLVLVASPGYLASCPAIEHPDRLKDADVDTIGHRIEGQEQTWSLVATDGQTLRVTHRPRLMCSDFTVQMQAAVGGVGVALLPLRLVWRPLGEGTLIRVAKDWGTPEQDIHLVFASKRGMLPSVRALIDYLVINVPIALGP
jgi:DNA-binding transcriptional LysR family regulator